MTDHRLDIDVDTYVECYHAQGDKSPRHYDATRNEYVSDTGAMEAALRNLMLAAPTAYQRSIKLSTVWRKLDAETRAYILRDIEHERTAYQPGAAVQMELC